jgi:hypothetical protein
MLVDALIPLKFVAIVRPLSTALPASANVVLPELLDVTYSVTMGEDACATPSVTPYVPFLLIVGANPLSNIANASNTGIHFLNKP